MTIDPKHSKLTSRGATSVSALADNNDDNNWIKWLVAALAVTALVIIGFFALGGDADVDLDPGNVDIDAPSLDVDVDAPDVDVDLPDVDVDAPAIDIDAPDVDIEGGDIDITDADAEADADQ